MMKVFTSGQIRRIDAYTIEHEPIRSIDLMERASVQLASWLMDRFDPMTKFSVYVGPGNNGGDGLAVSRLLAEKNYLVEVFMVKISDKLSPDNQVNLNRLLKETSVIVREMSAGEPVSAPDPESILLDTIFGSGLTRPVEGFAREIIRFLNGLPNLRIAIDIPSGLFGEDNSNNDRDAIFKADFTLGLQAPKLFLFFAENQDFAGEWDILPIGLNPAIMDQEESQFFYLTPEYIASLLRSRKKFSHKGTFGHALLIAGCYGMMGAAVLAAKACLRAGTGLVTSHIPRLGYRVVQTALPECLVSIDESDIIFTDYPELGPFTAVAAGPGLGCKVNSARGLYKLIKSVRVPLVIDADGLNIISENKEWLEELPPDCILTPHPREFDRLLGLGEGDARLSGYERNRRQIEFSKKYGVWVVLKGAHTSVSSPDGRCIFNTTGNPGMATAGSGDVLTGIILSLLAQGYGPEDAALCGVYLHGLAGDLAAEKIAEESLIAGDIIESLGEAFQFLK